MNLQLYVKVKFRAFGQDLGLVERTVKLPDDVALALLVAKVKPKTLFNERGVTIKLAVA